MQISVKLKSEKSDFSTLSQFHENIKEFLSSHAKNPSTEKIQKKDFFLFDYGDNLAIFTSEDKEQKQLFLHFIFEENKNFHTNQQAQDLFSEHLAFILAQCEFDVPSLETKDFFSFRISPLQEILKLFFNNLAIKGRVKNQQIFYTGDLNFGPFLHEELHKSFIPKNSIDIPIWIPDKFNYSALYVNWNSIPNSQLLSRGKSSVLSFVLRNMDPSASIVTRKEEVNFFAPINNFSTLNNSLRTIAFIFPFLKFAPPLNSLSSYIFFNNSKIYLDRHFIFMLTNKQVIKRFFQQDNGTSPQTPPSQNSLIKNYAKEGFPPPLKTSEIFLSLVKELSPLPKSIIAFSFFNERNSTFPIIQILKTSTNLTREKLEKIFLHSLNIIYVEEENFKLKGIFRGTGKYD